MVKFIRTTSRFCDGTTTLGYSKPSADLTTVLYFIASHAPGLLSGEIVVKISMFFPESLDSPLRPPLPLTNATRSPNPSGHHVLVGLGGIHGTLIIIITTIIIIIQVRCVTVCLKIRNISFSCIIHVFSL